MNSKFLFVEFEKFEKKIIIIYTTLMKKRNYLYGDLSLLVMAH